VSATTRTLKLRGRPDPPITRLDPPELTGPPGETPIKVERSDLDLDAAPARLMRVPTPVGVELEFPDGTTGHGAITGDTTPTALTFTLPTDTKAPAATETVAVQVVRGARASATSPLTLKPQ
jgi:hypothetical protein